MLRFIIILAVVCIVAALVLGGTHSITKPLIAAQKEREANRALENVIPGADRYEKRFFSRGEYYECYKGLKSIDYAIFTQGPGYAGDINMLVGIDKKGLIPGLEMVSQSETPGLGARSMEIKQGEKEPWFLRQFRGKSATALRLKDIESITGATITSEAILISIRSYVADFLKEIE